MPEFKRLFAVAVIIAAAAGAYAWHQSGAADKNAAQDVAVAAVERGSIEENVTAQGKLEPREYVDVGAQVSGQLKKIYVELGDYVHKGDLLAEIDPQIYDARVQSDTASLQNLNAQIAQQVAEIRLAELQFGRSEKLLATRAISQDAYDNARTTLDVARARKRALEAQVAQVQSSLDGNKANLGFTKIYAPMDGTVVAQSAREGQTLNANMSAPVLLQLANLDLMTVRAQVAEADIMNIKPGMEVYFTTLGSQGRKWQGEVRQVLPTPDIVNEVVLYNVLVDVDNKDRQLMSSMSTQMFFVLGRAENVPLVPVAALRRKDGEGYVVRLPGGEEKDVQIGLRNRSVAEVKEGLAVGDRVIVATAGAEGKPQRTPGPRMGPRL